MRPYLSDQRLKKVDAYRFLPDKVASAAVFCLLRLALKEQYDWDGNCDFGFGVYQKPYLLSRADVRFSLSHDRRGVGVCLSDSDVGADVQELFPYEKALAERILSPRERALFDRLGPDDGLFTRMWTMKESLGKKRGDGVFTVLESTDFSQVSGDCRVGDDYYTVGNIGDLYYAVCSEKPESVRFVDLEELFDGLRRLTKFQS